MKIISLLLSLFFLTNCAFSEKKWPKIYNAKTETWIQLDELEEIMLENRLVFVGEKHGHRWGHRIEKMLLETFFNVHGDVAVAMEMFERDIQNLLDGYLQNQIDENFFLRHSRPWKNYKTDYRPLVEFAKDMRLPVLAMNVPRRYSSFVAKNKEEILFVMPNKEQMYMAQRISAPKDRYFKKFKQAMGNMPDSMVYPYYRAQCFKDDTMAKSLAIFLNRNRSKHIIAYMGSFHSDERLGTVQRVSSMMPKVKSLVITIVPVEGNKITDISKHKSLADIIIFAPANPKSKKKKKALSHNPHKKTTPNPHKANPSKKTAPNSHKTKPSQKTTANPHKANPHKANPHKVNPHKANPHKANPHKANPHKVNPHKANPHKVNPHKANPHKTNPHKTNPHEVNPEKKAIPDIQESKNIISSEVAKKINNKENNVSNKNIDSESKKSQNKEQDSSLKKETEKLDSSHKNKDDKENKKNNVEEDTKTEKTEQKSDS